MSEGPSTPNIQSSGGIITPGQFGGSPDSVFRSAHHQSDVDTDRFAQHHTLGPGPYHAAPGNHRHQDFIGGGGTVVSGPWSSTPPPNTTTGVPVDIEVAGTYELVAQASGFFNGGTGPSVYSFYMDGNLKAQLNQFHNVASSHASSSSTVWSQYLDVGRHYFFIQYDRSSDTNDPASLTWTRIGSLSGEPPTLVSNPNDTGWITPGLLNGWVVNNENIAYRRINGITHLRGNVKNGIGYGTNAFILPPGFRTGQDMRLGNSWNAAGNVGIYIQVNGGVNIFNGPGLASEHGFDGISFPADN